MIGWATAFALTVAIELPLVAACAPRGRRRRAFGDALLANVLTHPLAWILIGDTLASWIAVELGVAVVEALVYRHVTALTWPRAIAASLLANGVTAALSFVV